MDNSKDLVCETSYVRNKDGTYKISLKAVGDDGGYTIEYPRVSVTWHNPARVGVFSIPIPVGFDVLESKGNKSLMNFIVTE